MRPNAEDITDFKGKLRGTLVQPGDDEYDAVRVVWNGMIDRRPGLIARCHGVADVIASVDFARLHGLRVAVRGGGHNVAGYAVCDGGMMIDLSLMRAVRVDPHARRAWVQGGATWGDVDHETTAFGLATPGGVVSSTGVGGLTLSGGIGWLRQTHGLCVDNLVSVDVVTADGRLLHADDENYPDLYWGVRGGGGNFGIVTSFEFRLHPIAPELMFCAPLYPEADAVRIIAAWRDFMATAPEQLSSLVEFSTIPDADDFPAETRGMRVLAVAAVYDGPADAGEAAVQPLRELGKPVLDFSGRMSYCAIQSLYDSLFPKGRDRNYFKSAYLASLSDVVILDLVGKWTSCPSPKSLTSVWHLGGAVQRVRPDATAFGDRGMSYMLSIDSIWSKPDDDSANITWSGDFWSAMQRHSTGRLYLNFAGLGEDEDLVRQAHGTEVYSRLAAIKRTYDPTNFFRLNQNIKQSDAGK
jgi:FAD/FMN-containing dehydrogenase